jgi:outer membrane receptor protein involved in Fe transport
MLQLASVRFAYLWLFILVFSLKASSQEVVVRGTVRDAEDRSPLVAATVQCNEVGTFTDNRGNFVIRVPPGHYQLHVSYVGYETVRMPVEAATDSVNVEILLSAASSLLGEVTVTTGKYEQPLGETTASIEILKPELLEQTNTTSIDEVLGKVPGVAIIDGQANIRGGSGFSYGAASRVLVLVDDIPAYQADAGFPNWDDFPMENMAQMEVVKGAASALYGSSALNGIINLRTAYAREEPVSKVAVFYGSTMNPRDLGRKWWDKAPNEYGISFSDARRSGKFDLVHAGYYLDRKSVNRENYNQYGRLNSKLRYRISDGVEMGIRGSFNRGINQNFFYWKDSEGGAYQGDSSTYSTGDYIRYSIDPYFKVITSRGDRHELKGRYFDVNNRNNANRSNKSQLYYGEYQFLHRMPGINSLATIGLVSLSTRVNAELYGDTTLTSHNLAFFAQFEKKIAGRLTFNTGFRYEQNVVNGPSQIGNDRIPEGRVKESKPVFRVAANYQLARGTYLRGSWGQGYRYPTIAEKYISTSFGATMVSPNLALESETGWSAEVGIKQGFQFGEFQGMADLAGYWSEYFDMMEFIFTGLIKGFQSQNIGDTRIRGFDFSVNARGKILGIPSLLLAGYTYIDPRFQHFTARDSINSTAGYNILKYRSKNLVKFDFQTDQRKINVGLSLQYTSHQEAIDRVFYLFIPGIEAFRESHRGYAITDVRLLFKATDQVTLTTQLRNLFNVEYSLRPGLLEPPRNFMIRIDYQW